MTMARRDFLPLAGLVLAMLLWGSSFIAMKLAFASYDPWWVIFIRMSIAALCFLPFLSVILPERIQREDIKYLLVMVVMEPGLYFILEAWALQNTTASQAGMITAMLPLMVAVAAGIWLKERISRRSRIGFTLAIIGVWWLSLSGESSASAPNPLLGNFLEFLAMVCATGYIVILKHLTSRYHHLFLTALQAFSGSLFFFPALFLPTTQVPQQLDLIPTLALIYLGTFVTVAAYGLYNYGVSRIPATQASAYINLIPVFSIILGFLILGERFTPGQFLASGLVFAGVLISQRPDPEMSVSDEATRKVELETG